MTEQSESIDNNIKLLSFVFTIAYIIFVLILSLIFRKQLKSELRRIPENKRKITMVYVIAIVTFEICYFMNFKQMLEALNNRVHNYSVAFFIGFAIYILYAVIAAPFAEEMFFRRLLYLKIKPEKTLQKAVEDRSWCSIVYYILLITVNSGVFALMHYDSDLSNSMPFFPWIFIY